MRVVVVLAALVAGWPAMAQDDYFSRSRRLSEQINDDMVRSTARREAEAQRAETERRLDELQRDNRRLQDEMQRTRRY